VLLRSICNLQSAILPNRAHNFGVFSSRPAPLFAEAAVLAEALKRVWQPSSTNSWLISPRAGSPPRAAARSRSGRPGRRSGGARRSPAAAGPGALLLAAGDRELDLQVSPRGQGWQLIGQVLGPDEPGSVTLATHGRRVSASINELGEFVLPVVSAGRYTLTLTQGGLEVVVPALEVGVEPL
jgi:hypothetical protein